MYWMFGEGIVIREQHVLLLLTPPLRMVPQILLHVLGSGSALITEFLTVVSNSHC